MSCINSELIQIYIDGEATPKQVLMIEKHIAFCRECAERINHQQRLATGVKSAVHLLTEDAVQIPQMTRRPGAVKKHFITGKNLIYIISAACILLFIFTNIPNKAPADQNEIKLLSGNEWEVDANRPLSEQQLILNVIDAEGNVTEYLVR